MNTKYIGVILEGRWEVVRVELVEGKHHYNFILKNIYNGEEMSIVNSVFYKIIRGLTTVSHIRKIRVRKAIRENKAP